MRKTVRAAALYLIAILIGVAVTVGGVESKPLLWACIVSIIVLAVVATCTLPPVVRLFAREEIAGLKREVEARDRKITEIEQLARGSAGEPAAQGGLVVENTPQVLISYRREPHEDLTFSSDGPTAHGVEFGPLVAKEQRTITLLSSIPTVRTGEKETRRMILEHRLSNGATESKPLEDFLRFERPEATISVTVNYRNAEGTEFARDFTLDAHPDGRVTWTPGPVRLKPSA